MIHLFTRWQWSVDLYKIRKATAKKKQQYTNKIKTQNTHNRKQNTKQKNIKIIIKNICRIISPSNIYDGYIYLH
jgi:hypothetical protein